MKLDIVRKGVRLVLKTCPGCGDEWYAKLKANRCSLCGIGLVRRTKANQNLNWDELKPQVSNAELDKFLRAAGLRSSNGAVLERSTV